jgi:hypothetical protein
MAWTTPLTAVANAALTSAQWNASVRDNLNVTAAAIAAAPTTTVGRIIIASGTNVVTTRSVASGVVATSETTTSTTYADLATAGPTLQLTTGENAVVWFSVQMSGSTNTAFVASAVSVSNATTIAASDADGLMFQPATASGSTVRATMCNHVQSLTPGSNAFKIQYRASAGTGTFSARRITVMGL